MNTASKPGGSTGPSTLYLDTLLLQPCDILLTRGGRKTSGWIARLSGGPYSHAAQVVNRALLFESDDVGVGYTTIRVDRIEGRGESARLLASLPGVTKAVVLRHPGLEKARAKNIEDDLVEALYPHFGKQYPEWEKLAPAAGGGSVFKRAVRALLRLLDRLEGETVWNPGPFCSQVAADALMKVLPKDIAPLFAPPCGSADVSPNAFLKSCLREVVGAITTADGSAFLNEEFQRRFDTLLPNHSRDQSTGMIVRARVQATKNKAQAKSLIEHEKELIKRLRDMLSPIDDK